MRSLICLAVALVPGIVGAQSTGSDISGIWAIDLSKSNYGQLPPPSYDTSKVSRVANQYHVESSSDFGGQGPQHLSWNWPIGDGEVTNVAPNGATLHTTTKMKGDTITFSSTVVFQGQTVAIQSGWIAVGSDGKTLTRNIEIQPMQGPSSQPLRMLLVYNKAGK
jgi:hypothetical protein